LERTEVKAYRTKEDHARHNSGGVRRLKAASLDDESSHNNNFNSKSLVEEENLFNFYKVRKTYKVQLPKNLMYLRLHPPKHGK